MAVKRPGGPLPMGNARRGFQMRPQTFPGAGERAPQGETSSGAPPGTLPTMFGASGFKTFLGGRPSIKRQNFQPLTRRRISPFFAGVVPTGLETPSFQSFTPVQVSDPFVPPGADAASTDLARARAQARRTGSRVKVSGASGRKIALQLFKSAQG